MATPLIVLPSPYRCSGKCGDGEICAESIYTYGYCVEPAKREKALEKVENT